MAFDLVNWSPAISPGAANDNAYNFPGATKLDGSFDGANAPTSIMVGASSYSATPTIAEINAGSGINQIIALINRRGQRYKTLFGTSFTSVPYLSAATFVAANDFSVSLTNGLKKRINALRSTEGLSAFAYANTIAAGKQILGSHVAELRKALGINGTFSPPFAQSWLYTRTDSTWNSTVAATEVIDGDPFFFDSFGKALQAFLSKRHFRYMFKLNIPDWVTVVPVQCHGLLNLTIISEALEAFTPAIYSFNSDIGAPGLGTGFNGDFYHGTFEASFTDALGAQAVTISSAPILSRAGQHFFCMYASTAEYNGTGLAVGSIPGDSDGKFANANPIELVY